MQHTQRPLPLDGVLVAEFTHTVMGPTCGMVLGDLGARVIKIEPPEGDQTRRLVGLGAGFFSSFNRNKESLAVDLKDPRGRAVVLELVQRADVLIENFAPATMPKLGLGYEVLSALNPRLIYCSLKGFLPGPYEHRLALDEVVQMMGGLAYMTGPPGQPLRAGASVIDIMGGTFGVIGILAALRERERTGHGELVQSALFESVAFLMAQHMAQGAFLHEPATPMPARQSAWAVYEIFTTRDGAQLFLGITTDRTWQRFCDEFARPDLLADPRLATNNDRIREKSWFGPEIARIVAQYDAADILARCERAGIPCTTIGTPQDLYEDPHLRAAGLLHQTRMLDGMPAPLPGIPLAFAGHPFPLRCQPPGIGQDTGEVLHDLGYPPEAIEELARAGVVTLGTAEDLQTVAIPR